MYVTMWYDAMEIMWCDSMCIMYDFVMIHSMMPNDMYVVADLYMWMDNKTKCMKCKQYKCMYKTHICNKIW